MHPIPESSADMLVALKHQVDEHNGRLGKEPTLQDRDGRNENASLSQPTTSTSTGRKEKAPDAEPQLPFGLQRSTMMYALIALLFCSLIGHVVVWWRGSRLLSVHPSDWRREIDLKSDDLRRR